MNNKDFEDIFYNGKIWSILQITTWSNYHGNHNTKNYMLSNGFERLSVELKDSEIIHVRDRKLELLHEI